MFLLSFEIHYVRDVGAAGSNPVTPTIDFREIIPEIAGVPPCFLLGVPLGCQCVPLRECSDADVRKIKMFVDAWRTYPNLEGTPRTL